MAFQFDSLQAFALMEGHGPFVWASFGITVAVLIYLVVSPIGRQRRAIARQRRRLSVMAHRSGEAARHS